LFQQIFFFWTLFLHFLTLGSGGKGSLYLLNGKYATWLHTSLTSRTQESCAKATSAAQP